jgi:hypothetical protein
MKQVDCDRTHAEKYQCAPLQDETSFKITKTENQAGYQAYNNGSFKTGKGMARDEKEQQPGQKSQD